MNSKEQEKLDYEIRQYISYLLVFGSPGRADPPGAPSPGASHCQRTRGPFVTRERVQKQVLHHAPLATSIYNKGNPPSEDRKKYFHGFHGVTPS